ncbi:MAG: YigZ family protein [Bacteroidales bacterium]
MEKDEFLTINKPAESLYKEKGSKFLSFILPVQNEENVKEKLEAIKNKHYSARHHCYAYKLGIEKEIFRMNDDGEPSSTAGKPIYGQILAYDLTNVLIIVVRYFGGTKLGTSGLIRAYKSAAEKAIENSKIVKKTIGELFTIEFDYEHMKDVMKIIYDENLVPFDKNFQAHCTFTLGIRKKDQKKLLNRADQTKKLKIKKLNKTVYI